MGWKNISHYFIYREIKNTIRQQLKRITIFVTSRVSSAKLFKMSANLFTVLSKLYEEYNEKTPSKLKLVDGFLLYVLLTGVIQFVYCCLVGTFPFNSFLSGFISCVGTFVLAVCLRVQTNPKNRSEFKGISPERAFADFIFANIVLHLVVMNFIG